MTGDRIKELEAGFLAGSLSDAEEQEFKVWLKAHPEHELSPYFTWIAQADGVVVPDLRPGMAYKTGIWNQTWFKVAAAMLILVTAGFLLKTTLLKQEPAQTFTEAEIDRSYKATLETLSAMAGFLDKSLSDAEQAIDLSKPFEKLNELKDENPK